MFSLENIYKQGDFWKTSEEIIDNTLADIPLFIVVKGEENPAQLNWFKKFKMKEYKTNVLSNTVDDLFVFKSVETAQDFVREKLTSLEVGKNLSIISRDAIHFKNPRKEILIEKLWKIGDELYSKDDIKIRKGNHV